MAKSAPKHFFSKLASVNTPRSWFNMSYTNTGTMCTDFLIPCMKQLVLPGDTWKYSVSSMVRMIDPLDVPMMDNLYMDYDFWFVPWRLVWKYTKNFFGEQRRPDDPTDFTIPTILFNADAPDVTQTDGYDPRITPDPGLPKSCSIYDYFKVPIQGTDGILVGSFDASALPLRSYNLIFDEWYRDEQRVDYSYFNEGNTQDTADKYFLLRRGKRFDLMTSTLLEPQIGTPVDIPLGTTAPVVTTGLAQASQYGYVPMANNTGTASYGILSRQTNGTVLVDANSMSLSSGLPTYYQTDLSQASAATIATLRNAFQVQAYQELLARGGTRYTEFLYSIYSVISPDARLQRPEFLGRVHFRLFTQPVVQNSATGDTPQGNLAGIVYGACDHNFAFERSFTEHGFIIGLKNIYADLTYYQGLSVDWQMRTPLDVPMPVFGNLTDEALLRKTILLTGTAADDTTFGYAERYAPYKYSQNTLDGLVRPNAPQSIGYWSLAQQLPSNLANNDEFILNNTPIERISADTSTKYGANHFIVNEEFTGSVIRELPAYSDPMQWFRRS